MIKCISRRKAITYHAIPRVHVTWDVLKVLFMSKLNPEAEVHDASYFAIIIGL